MRKRIVPAIGEEPATAHHWLDLEASAEVELTSEAAAHPIEAALAPSGGAGWRAAGPGPQTIRILFHTPQRLRRIRLRFDERDAERTQEFTLRWSADGGRTYRDIVRQQYTFSPAGANSQVEDLAVDLTSVTALELNVMPDQHGRACASLTELRVG
jgi:hypothetical protein